MSFVINIGGTITPAETARISALDRGFLYGDSVYEVLRTYDGRPFCLAEHLERLDRSAAGLHLEIPPRGDIVRELDRTLEAGANDESYVRIVVTRGAGPLTLDPTGPATPVTLIYVKEFEPYPQWMYERGIRLAITSVERTSPAALDPAIKSGNYLNSVLALGEAKRRGFDDALLLHKDGRATECTNSNLFAVIDDKLVTPHLAAGLLAGVTRRLILELAARDGISCEERDLLREDLSGADEVMISSTLREVVPVRRIEDDAIGSGSPGPLYRRLRALIRDRASFGG